jgi:hypothetical protein
MADAPDATVVIASEAKQSIFRFARNCLHRFKFPG